jgi:hypothetical protein
VPIASPAAEFSDRASSPRHGRALDDALHTASTANDEFNRGLHGPVSGSE